MSTVAIIPCAGKGTRMQLVTAGGSKELLPLNGKPVLAWIVEEALKLEARPVVVVSHAKTDLIDYCRNQRIQYVFQHLPLGLAHAIGQVEHKGSAYVLLGDTVLSNVHALTDEFAHPLADRTLILVQSVGDHLVSQYGIVEVDESYRVLSIREKPDPSITSSRLAVCARYRLSANTLAFIQSRSATHTASRELGLTSLLNEWIALGNTVEAMPLPITSKRLDCGTPREYSEALTQSWN
jgi:dTDP-glucose pyrophosphorylase